MSRASSARPWWKRRAVIGPAAAVVLAAAMIQQTTFVGAGEEISSAEGSSTEEAAELAHDSYESTVRASLMEEPVPLTDLAPAASDDPETAGEQNGRHEAEGKPYSYAVTASGTVTEGEFGEIGLEIDGVPDGMSVGIAVPPFGSSTALRDYGLDVQYGDFENQIAYQLVAIELNALAAEDAYGSTSPDELLGSEVTVIGAITWSSTTGGDVTHVSILPVSIEVNG